MNQSEHVLTCVSEECNEIAQVAMRMSQAAHKALRFGMIDGYPETERTNCADLVREANDLIGALERLQEAGIDLPGLFDRSAIDAKKSKINKWMGHAEALGTLQR